jgi:hypothetical protein
MKEKEYFEAILTRSVHCLENPIYVRYSPKRNCAVSVLISTFGYVSDLHIATIGPPIFLQPNRQIESGNIYNSLTDI